MANYLIIFYCQHSSNLMFRLIGFLIGLGSQYYIGIALTKFFLAWGT